MRPALAVLVSAVMTGCAGLPAQQPSNLHLRNESIAQQAPDKAIPAPVAATSRLPPPKAAAKTETYSVSVRNIPAQDLLFALARDAKLNIDLHPGISGTVTINAIDQTLQQILTRLSKQVDMRWELDGPNLVVMPDTPFLRNYRVDYVNMVRDVKVTTEVNSQVSASGSATGGAGTGAITHIESTSKNSFWVTLEKNIKDILHETDKVLPEGSSETTIEKSESQNSSGAMSQKVTQPMAGGKNKTTETVLPESNSARDSATIVKRVNFREAASVIANPETGVVAVRATSRQHEKIQDYVDMVTNNARRQVMIEATIVEVALDSGFEQGIQWEGIRTLLRGQRAEGVLKVLQNGAGPSYPTASSAKDSSFLMNFASAGAGIAGTIKLLETYGNVKVLSSPKVSVLNNQTAVIKVVDNLVYFSVKADTTTSSAGAGLTTVTTTPNTVAVGLVMSVTPQISDSNSIILNVRPTISRKSGEKQDPNPSIPNNIANMVPEIATREMESMLRLTDGETAVMGGLMSDEINNNNNNVPGLSRVPGLGFLFSQRNDTNVKKELVIFLKPTIIRDPSLRGDFSEFAQQLPGKDFFANNPGSLRPADRGAAAP